MRGWPSRVMRVVLGDNFLCVLICRGASRGDDVYGVSAAMRPTKQEAARVILFHGGVERHPW